MATHTFNYPLFQSQIPAYATTPVQSVCAAYWSQAALYVNPDDNWCGGLADGALDLALNLLTAHLIYINNLILAGQTTAIVTGSTIDKITVNLLAPPVKNMFQYWLATSPYGQQLLALLRAKAAGGWYVGKGIAERRGFRKAYGTFR